MLEYITKNKKYILIVTIFLIVIIILSIVVNALNKDNNKVLVSSYVSNLTSSDLKEITDCNISEVLKDSDVPFFKLSNEFYNKFNDEIVYEFLLRACYQNGIISYDTTINDNILSLALNISYESVNDLTYVEYKTYNIDINENVPVDNATILNKYNRTIDDVTNTVMSRLLSYYDYEQKHNYLTTETSFSNYLEILEYEPITIDNMKLFIDKNNDLWLYKEYTLSEAMMRYDDYPVISIKFKLT